LKACPMCRVPVTFGGGNWMQKGDCPGVVEAENPPEASHCA